MQTENPLQTASKIGTIISNSLQNIHSSPSRQLWPYPYMSCRAQCYYRVQPPGECAPFCKAAFQRKVKGVAFEDLDKFFSSSAPTESQPQRGQFHTDVRETIYNIDENPWLKVRTLRRLYLLWLNILLIPDRVRYWRKHNWKGSW